MRTPSPIRVATRGSPLALAQTRQVAAALERAHGGLHVELMIVTTSGDQIHDRSLHELGGKGLFTKEVEQALLSGAADFAVHSSKDMPVTQPLLPAAAERLVIPAVPEREDPRDVLLTPRGWDISKLPQGARVGTSSRRRAVQLLEMRPDARVVPLRGNVDTRLAKLDAGEFDGIVLAMAGLLRLGRFDPDHMHPLAPHAMTPAAGQGALALQCRHDDSATRALLAALDHPDSRQCVEVERAVVAALEGDCTSPIGAWAQTAGGGQFHLLACDEVAGLLRRAEAAGPASAVVEQVKRALRQA